MRITQRSAEEFANAFVSLAAVAEANDTSARCLVLTSQRHGIFVLTVETSHINASFVRREDAEIVVKYRKLDKQTLEEECLQEQRPKEFDGRKALMQSAVDTFIRKAGSFAQPQHFVLEECECRNWVQSRRHPVTYSSGTTSAEANLARVTNYEAGAHAIQAEVCLHGRTESDRDHQTSQTTKALCRQQYPRDYSS